MIRFLDQWAVTASNKRQNSLSNSCRCLKVYILNFPALPLLEHLMHRKYSVCSDVLRAICVSEIERVTLEKVTTTQGITPSFPLLRQSSRVFMRVR